MEVLQWIVLNKLFPALGKLVSVRDGSDFDKLRPRQRQVPNIIKYLVNFKVSYVYNRQ